MPPPVPSAFLYAIDENASAHAPARPNGRLDSQRSSGAVALTSALLSSKYSSGSYAGSTNGLYEPQVSGSNGALLQEASAHDTLAQHLSGAQQEGALGGGRGQLRDARLSSTSGKLSEGEEHAALLAVRADESCGGKPEPAQHARASKAGSGGGGAMTWWTQSWAVRLCVDCARCGPPVVLARPRCVRLVCHVPNRLTCACAAL
jgi:hypothetical protein